MLASARPAPTPARSPARSAEPRTLLSCGNQSGKSVPIAAPTIRM
jgi:hypothetical protein